MPRSKSALEEQREAIKRRENVLNREKAAARRFNDPLKLFIQRKYNNIYKEYIELYTRMLAEVPRKKNLCRTLIFKQFLIDHPDEQDQGNKQAGGAEGQGPCKIQGKALYVPQVRLKPVEEEATDLIEEDPDILTQALAAAIGTDPAELDPFEYDLRVEEVHLILEEMSKAINLDIKPIGENPPGKETNPGQDIEQNIEGGIGYFDSFEKDVQLFNHC